MEGQVIVEEETQEKVVDGRTIVAKLQVKVQKLEDAQIKICELLAKHQKRIDECSVRR